MISRWIVALLVSSAAHARAQTPASLPNGRITGRVVDGTTGQPLAHVQVGVVDRTVGAQTDLDGRYTISAVAPGLHAVLARRIGLQAKRYDSVTVVSGQATIVNFTLAAATVSLQSLVIQATRTDASASEASLLAIQQRAAAASDGISAEQIKRTPDSDAGAAATRVSGISVVDSKFVIVRGLSERYSTTLVNGVDVASPEPAKKIVPLDIFPSSLLESIVVSKSATPDKPGDFSGGAVEVKTKEFPENAVRQFSLSQGFNSQSTMSRSPFPHRTFWDYLGFDRGRRAPHGSPDSTSDIFALERYAEGLRREWSPSALRALPNLGLGFTLGDQKPGERASLGYVLSLTYSASNDRAPDRFSQFYTDPNATPNRGYVYQDYHTVVDWGGVGNVALRLGSGNKLSLKNLYSRNADELYSTADGFSVDRNGALRTYQFQYVERDLLQSQLAGEHLLDFLWSSRLEWKATLSHSGRDEPDNRQVTYLRSPSSDRYALGSNSDAWIRSLTDRQVSAQVDYTLPARLLWHDFTFKAGGLTRNKTRKFDALLVSFNPGRSDQIPDDLVYLPPELLFTPENIGGYLQLGFPGSTAQPYDADDKLTAWYGMVDTDILPRVRLVGGVRAENWSLDLFDGGRAKFARGDTSVRPTFRRNNDLLWSANTTVSITDRMNLRLAGFASVARPDTRELSVDEYVDIVGSCATIGNPLLRRTKILNADARWEWYPAPGEILSVSGFYKHFDEPIIRVVIGRNGCTFTYQNATSAENTGFELEARKNLSFLPGALRNLSAGVNYTHVVSSIIIDPAFGVYNNDLTLEGQSPYLVNASLTYLSDGVTATLLFNQFGDRIVRYGFRSSGGATATQGPNIVEHGRGTLDAKVQKPVGRGFTLSVSGKNLTNSDSRFFQVVKGGPQSTGVTKPGVTLSVGMGYAR